MSMQVLGDRQLRRVILDHLVRSGKLNEREAEMSFASRDAYEDLRRRVSDEDIAEVLGEVSGDAVLLTPEAELDEQLSNELRQHLSSRHAVALSRTDEVLRVGVLSTLDDEYLDSLRAVLDRSGYVTDREIEFVIVPGGFIRSRSSGGVVVEKASGDRVKDLLEHIEDVEDEGAENWQETAAGRALLGLIYEALSMNASDISIRARSETESEVKYRVDGDVRDIHLISSLKHRRLVQVIKLASKMDVASNQTAQDGSIKLEGEAGNITLRANVLPTLYGVERATLRLIRSGGQIFSLTELGFLESELAEIQKGLIYSQGMVLVTGPTGSGKNTTLYAMLRHSYRATRAYLSVENPIEAVLDFMDQVEVTEQLTFPAVLKAFLRQDPDVIMVAEIREGETAKIASEAAMTGHLIFSTLHTNSAPDTLLRIRNLGIDNQTTAQIINLLVAQRLSKRLCPHCRIGKDASVDLLAEHLPVLDAELIEERGYAEGELFFHNPSGCDKCDQTGFAGRTVVAEAVYVDATYKEYLLDGDLGQFARRLREQRKDILHAAMTRVQKGVIGLDSVADIIPRQ